MALSDSILRMKDKVTGAVQNFFYPRDEYPRDERTVRKPREGRRIKRNNGAFSRNEEQYAEEEDTRSENAWSAPQVSESSPFQNTNPYTSPAQSPYQQQAPYQAQQQAPYQAAQPQGAYQSQGQFQQPQSPYQQPQGPYQQQGRENGGNNILYFPNAPQGQAQEATIRVVTARGIADCYGAITQLRLGDAVILVMDGINDPAEMRHYVQNPYGQVRYADPYGRQDQGRADPYAQQAAAQAVNQNGRDYYGRTAMPDAQVTADHLQPYANGYMPDFPADEARAQ